MASATATGTGIGEEATRTVTGKEDKQAHREPREY
jgi:hypothetical protein